MPDDEHKMPDDELKLTESQVHRAVGRRVSDALKWWPLAVVAGGALLSYGEIRYRVATIDGRFERIEKELERIEETDRAQWQRIGDLMRGE